MKSEKNYILSADVAEKKLKRMAYEILENNIGENHVILAGIQHNGYVIAQKLLELLKGISDISFELISVSMDKKHPSEIKMETALDFNDKVVILVDDVTNSGKTLMYALKPFLQQYPKKIQILVMVERSHKKYPVQPDYVGISLTSTLQEHIYVEVEGDRITGAYLE
jgi:pyrimidine operon attenuation protein / uracil phosphoribosyltransferase